MFFLGKWSLSDGAQPVVRRSKLNGLQSQTTYFQRISGIDKLDIKPICCFIFDHQTTILVILSINLKCERPIMNSLKSTSPLPSSSKMSITLLKLLGMGSRCGWTITWRGDSAAIQARTWTPNTLLQRNYTLCIRALPMMMSSFAFNDNHEQKFSYLYWSRKNPFSLSNMCSIFYHNQF